MNAGDKRKIQMKTTVAKEVYDHMTSWLLRNSRSARPTQVLQADNIPDNIDNF